MGCPWKAVDIHENRWTGMDICIHGYLLSTLVCLLVRWLPPSPPHGTLVRRSYDVCSNFAWWSRRIVGRPVSRLVAEGDASCPLESFESAC